MHTQGGNVTLAVNVFVCFGSFAVRTFKRSEIIWESGMKLSRSAWTYLRCAFTEKQWHTLERLSTNPNQTFQSCNIKHVNGAIICCASVKWLLITEE